MLMADAGWHVTFLSSPIVGWKMVLPTHPRIDIRTTVGRVSYIMGKGDYLRYVASTARLAVALRPALIYASDPLGAAPGLLAARITGARLLYHEHDTPNERSLHPWIAKARDAALRTAAVVVFPNEERARIVQAKIGRLGRRIHIVWNMPRRNELPTLQASPPTPLRLWFHGSITPERLPESAVMAVQRFGGSVRLDIAGYEAPGAKGYLDHILSSGARDGARLIRYCGQLPDRAVLLAEAASSHVGLSFMPKSSDDINMRNMSGASNKPFDYMAAGLPLIVTDLPDWRRMFAEPGYALACDPTDVESIAAALNWFLTYPEERSAMATRCRQKIACDWNYDQSFAPVLKGLNEGLSVPSHGT